MNNKNDKPSGEWVLVPREPTDEMAIAFAEKWFSRSRPLDDPELEDAYAAMLAAAPKPESAEAVGDRQAWYEAEIAKAERKWIDGFSRRYEAGDDVPSMLSFVALWLGERTAPPRPEASAPVGVRGREAAEHDQFAAIVNALHGAGESMERSVVLARGVAAALAQQPAAVDEALIQKLRGYLEDINNDVLGQDYLDISCDALELIDKHIAGQQQGGTPE